MATQMELRLEEKLKDPGPETATLLSIIQQYSGLDGHEKWKLAPHQRSNIEVWPKPKQENWIRDCRSTDTMAPSMFLTYELRSNPGIIYLNDGLQRLTATKVYYVDPEPYGDTKEDATKKLASHKFVIFHNWYASHKEAYAHFRRVQYGVICTPYEELKGILIYMSDAEQWESLLDQVKEVCDEVTARICDRFPRGRIERHKSYRDNYALFLRWLTHDETLKDYRPSSSVNESDREKGRTIEHKLVIELTTRGIDEIKQELRHFSRILREATAEIVDVWHNELQVDALEKPTYQCARWLLAVAIYAKNKNLKMITFRVFAKSVLAFNSGSTTVQDPKNKRTIYSVGMSKLSVIPKIGELVGHDINLNYREEKAPQNIANIMTGSQGGHEKGEAPHGNGPIRAQSASENREMGTKDMPEKQTKSVVNNA